MRQMEKTSQRTQTIVAIKNLIVLGNTLMFYPPDGGRPQVYGLRDYVVERDASGFVVQIITQDCRIMQTLPEELYAVASNAGRKPEDKMTIFTGVTWDGSKYVVKQELEDLVVTSDQKGSYPEKDLPWIPLTWNLVRGYNYGQGLVEEYSGDFATFSSLCEATLDLAMIAADIKILVNPQSNTDVDALNNSSSGSFVHGREEDISYLAVEKGGDFQFVQTTKEEYSRRIGAAFLMNSQVTRNAERVTAEEIRLQANELESSLGGVYSRLSEEMQQPIARKLLEQLDTGLKDLEPTVLTGVESLSRNSEHEQMILFLQDLSLLNNVPEDVRAQIDTRGLSKILATNRGLDYETVMMSDAQLQERQKQEAAAQKEQAMMEASAKQQAQAPPTQQPPM